VLEDEVVASETEATAGTTTVAGEEAPSIWNGELYRTEMGLDSEAIVHKEGTRGA